MEKGHSLLAARGAGSPVKFTVSLMPNITSTGPKFADAAPALESPCDGCLATLCVERHLRRVLSRYFQYHHEASTRQGLVRYSSPPRAITLSASRRSAACSIAMSVEPRKIGEAALLAPALSRAKLNFEQGPPADRIQRF